MESILVHFHSIFPFHFASSNPSFFIDPIASTISNKRFFLLDHDSSFDLANDLHKLVPLPYAFQQHLSSFCVILDTPSFLLSLFVEFTVMNRATSFTFVNVCCIP